MSARLPATPDLGPDVAGWDGLPRAALPMSAPVLAVAGFEGPLDWLLEMAKARRIDLARLSILALVDAFGAALDAALAQQRPDGATFDLPRWGDWTVQAAQLAELRSRLLLPEGTPGNRSAQAGAAALRRQLLGRAAIGAAADWLERRPQLGRDVFGRGEPDTGFGRTVAEDADARGQPAADRGDITALLRACLVALRLPEGAQADRPRQLPFWTVAQATPRLERQLGSAPDGDALEAFLPRIAAGAPDREFHCKAALASTLRAGLELARHGTVTLEQEQPWQTIRVLPVVRTSEHTNSP